MTYHNNADANDERTLDVVVVGTCVSVHDRPLGNVAPAVNESHTVASLHIKLVMHVGISHGETREEKRRSVVVFAHRNPDMFRAWWTHTCNSTLWTPAFGKGGRDGISEIIALHVRGIVCFIVGFIGKGMAMCFGGGSLQASTRVVGDCARLGAGGHAGGEVVNRILGGGICSIGQRHIGCHFASFGPALLEVTVIVAHGSDCQ